MEINKKNVSSKNSGHRSAGFTLVELLLVVALISALSGISIPLYQSFQVKNNLDVGVNDITQSLKRAQLLSQAVDGDMSWGVKVQSGSIAVFKGASYATRDANFDETFDFPTSVVPSGVTEIVFEKFTGVPLATGTIILTTSTNESKSVVINSKGMVEY